MRSEKSALRRGINFLFKLLRKDLKTESLKKMIFGLGY